MKYLRKLIAFIFILPVVFIMVGCTGPQSTAPANPGQVEETLPDNSSESSSDNSSEVDNDEAVNDENGDDDNQPEITEPSDEAADDQKPAEPSQPEEPGTPSQPTEPDSSQDDNDAETDPEDETDNENNDNPEQPAEPEAPTEPEAPEELPSQPEIENPSEPEVPSAPEETPSEPEPEIPSESEEPTDPDTPAEPETPEELPVQPNPDTPTEPETPEENAFYTVDFELLSYSMDPNVVKKYETPMTVMTFYPDIQIESNDGLLFFVDEFSYGGGQYAIHFKNDFEKEICTTEENGTQILEFDVHYQSYTPCAIMINGSLVAKLQPTTFGFETASFKIEISSDSTFTLDLTAIM